MFEAVYRIFRAKGPLPQAVRTATALVELVNIDLYNHWKTNPAVRDYRGTVYRGMSISPENLQSFRDLAQQLPGKRAFAVPLALNSSSTRLEATIPFMERGMASNPSLVPVLQRIHVHGLSPVALETYQACYPGSVVSTICATPIGHLSRFPSEAEVLLRGPFFELVVITEHLTLRVSAKPVHVLEVVMMNSNRDHPSAPQTRAFNPARQLFNSLVSADKLEACAVLADELGLSGDSPLYRTGSTDAKEVALAAVKQALFGQ